MKSEITSLLGKSTCDGVTILELSPDKRKKILRADMNVTEKCLPDLDERGTRRHAFESMEEARTEQNMIRKKSNHPPPTLFRYAPSPRLQHKRNDSYVWVVSEQHT